MKLTNEWAVIDGFCNLGEDVDTIVAKKEGNTTTIMFYAYGGVKVVELDGITEVFEPEYASNLYSLIISEYGDDWEVAFPIGVKGGAISIVIVDDCGDVTTLNLNDKAIGTDIKFISSEEYDVDSYDELDDYALGLLGIM